MLVLNDARSSAQQTFRRKTSFIEYQSHSQNTTFLLALLDGGMKWGEKPPFPVSFHTSIQQRLFIFP